MSHGNFVKAVEALRKQEKKKFLQGVDLIINLKNFDPKKESVNVFVPVNHKVKEKKIMALLTKRTGIIDSLTKLDFEKYKDKKQIKSLIKKYDFFIASAPVMPAVASTFGKYLGPAGKMPSPQLGVLMQEDDASIKNLLEKISKTIRVKSKDASLKVLVAKEGMKDSEIVENAEAVLNSVINALPRKKEQIKSVLIKFTMSKPEKVLI